MSETGAMIIGVAVGLSLVVVIGLGYRWRKRRVAGRGIAVVPMPAEEWTDEDVDPMLSALQAPDSDDHEGGFV